MPVIRDLLIGNEFSAKGQSITSTDKPLRDNISALKNAVRQKMPIGTGWSKSELDNILEIFMVIADKSQNLWPTLEILKMVASQPANLSLGPEVSLLYSSSVTVHFPSWHWLLIQ